MAHKPFKELRIEMKKLELRNLIRRSQAKYKFIKDFTVCYETAEMIIQEIQEYNVVIGNLMTEIKLLDTPDAES